MEQAETLQSLDPAQRKLVQLMQELNFGRIENLVVANGLPNIGPRTRIVHEVKFAAENGPRPERCSEDFALKAQVLDLLGHLQQLNHGVIESLVVKHGLPFSMNVCGNVPLAA